MPAAAAAGPGASAPGGGGGGGNPFQLATNLYAEKNNVGNLSNVTVTTTQTSGGGQINAGQYLRGVRLVVRSQASASVTTQGSATTDWPFNLLTQIDFVNVDGSEILYVMGGYAHYLAQKYGKPWLGDPIDYPDAFNATAAVPQFTLFLQPEIRWTAGVLANTDTRSQYRFDYTVDTIANITGANGSSYNTGSQAPIVTITPYMDAWAQPDAEDLQGPLALDTPVETRAGWKTMADLVIGDDVLGSDGEWTPIIGTSKTFTGRACYRLTIGDEQIVCDGEHLWPTVDAHGITANRTAAELAEGGAYRIAGHEKIDSIEPVESVATRCIATGRDDHLFLVGRTHVPTHNTPNQPVPPGLNLQYKRRHQIFTMNATASDNIFQSALTGNALRNQILVTRNGGSARTEGLTDPIIWQIDNRSMGKFSTNNPGTGAGTASTSGATGGDILQSWMTDFYAEYFFNRVTGSTTATQGFTRESGVYVFPRFLKPGSLYGQGWLYTANSTKEIFESTSGAITTPTMELISDEVYPVGPVDPQLTDI